MATRGGAGRGQGRKPLAGEPMEARPIRMTDAQWEKCKKLGGAAWVRDRISEAKVK